METSISTGRLWGQSFRDDVDYPKLILKPKEETRSRFMTPLRLEQTLTPHLLINAIKLLLQFVSDFFYQGLLARKFLTCCYSRTLGPS